MKRTWIKAFSTVIVLFMALSMFACSSDEKGEETTTAGSDMTSQETETASTQTESVDHCGNSCSSCSRRDFLYLFPRKIPFLSIHQTEFNGSS